MALTDTVTEPSPDALAGDTVAQDALEDAVQLQPVGAVTVSVAFAAPAPTETVRGETVKLHGTPA